MIQEHATVVEVDEHSLLVETIQRSTCGSCVAQKGCGQGVLAKYLSSSTFFRVNIDDQTVTNFRPGDTVELGIDEMALVRVSLWLYAIPLAGLMVGAYVGSLHSEMLSVLSAFGGLLLGGYFSARQAKKVKNDPQYAPVLVVDQSKIQLVDISRSLEA